MRQVQPLAAADDDLLASVRLVLTDLDDTLTLDGRLPAASYAALETLRDGGFAVIIVTGRPAGWCDLIARLWPITAVVGENGAFVFRYDAGQRRIVRRFQRTNAERHSDRQRLEGLLQGVRARYPKIRLAADQDYRISDVAIDICEEASPPLSEIEIAGICSLLEAGGATAKVSSIHVNAWIGSFSKLDMSLALLADDLGIDPATARRQVVYAGDSPNDEPMFAYFPLSVGVANIARFLPAMASPPRWLTRGEGGAGFAELSRRLLSARR
ncbi:MAG: HAD-IIB family hydrolase [Hyphomicrobiaceae bacterium]|nr:HAD-IIB family hydrolase [Hyphomicrobiaceae bacterium]